MKIRYKCYLRGNFNHYCSTKDFKIPNGGNNVKIVSCFNKTLHKHMNFKVWVDEIYEATCCDIICKQPYRDNLPIGIP